MFNKIIKWLTWLMNLLFYTVLVNLALLIASMLLRPFIGGLWLRLGFFVVINAVFLTLFGKRLYRTIFLPKADDVQATVYVGRSYTARKYVLLGICINIVLIIAVWIFGGDLLSSLYILLLLFVIPCGLGAWGFYHPEDRAGKNFSLWLNFGIFGALFLSFVLYTAYSSLPRKFTYESKGYAPMKYYSLRGFFIEKMIPPEATDIKISGNTGMIGMGFYVTWSCQVAESDFLEFARKNDYALKENDPYYNANPETAMDQVKYNSFAGLSEYPESFYSYNYRYRNHGGWTLIYDRSKQLLYGGYASN